MNSDAGRTTGPYELYATPGTPHHTLLNSNEAPLEGEVPIVASTISRVDARLVDLDEEIGRLENRLQELEAERISLSHYRTQNLAVLSPLRRMPSEVLAEIFLCTLPSAWYWVDFGGAHVTESPWLLTHISRRWRAVACSTPSLWSVVDICFGTDANPVSLSMVEAQMACSRAQKLRVHFYGCEISDPRPQIEIFRCLAKHSSRWEVLNLQMTSHLIPCLEHLRDSVPSFRRLWIQWESPESQAEVESIDFCQTAPSLVDVAVFNQHRYIPIHLPLHQLTRYDIDAPWEIHRGMLKRMPNLVGARVKTNFDEERWLDSAEIMDFLFLRRLCVSSPYMLKFFRFPVLEEIAIDVEEGGGHDILPSLELSVARSSCRLRKVFFYGCPAAAAEILEKFPSVVELAIVIDSPADNRRLESLVQTLTISEVPGSRVVASHLRCLAFASIEDGRIVPGIYLEMVKSRWKAECCALESAVVLANLDSNSDSVTIDALKVLGEEGLDFELVEGVDAARILDGWLCHSLWS